MLVGIVFRVQVSKQVFWMETRILRHIVSSQCFSHPNLM